MKKSVIIFLSWMGLLFLVMLSLFIYGRIALGKITSELPDTQVSDSHEWEFSTVDLSNVSKLDFEGSWTVYLYQGESNDALIRSPGEAFWTWKIETDETGQNTALFAQVQEEYHPFEIHITLSNLNSFRNEGVLEAYLEGISLNDLRMENNGMASL